MCLAAGCIPIYDEGIEQFIFFNIELDNSLMKELF